LADYRDHYDEIRRAGGELITVSADVPARSEMLRELLHLPFVMLSDVERRVVRQWDIYNARERGGIAKPTVYVLEPDRRVRFVEVDGVASRVHASAILPIVRGDSPFPRVARALYVPSAIDFLRALRNQM